MGRKAGDLLAVKQYPAGRWGKIPGDAIKQGGFAGAVGAQDSAPLTGPDPQVDGVQRHQRTEMPAHALQYEGVSRIRVGDSMSRFAHVMPG